MSADETKWKKKVKVNNNIPHVPDMRKKNDTASNDSMSALNELKNKIEIIKNKRNGFTRLPNLEDIHTKQLDDLITPEDVSVDKHITEEGFDPKSVANGVSKSVTGVVSNEKLVRYISIVLAYIFLIISYLHIIFMNFKDTILNNDGDYSPSKTHDEENIDSPFVRFMDQLAILLTAKPGSEEYIKHARGNVFLKILGVLCRAPLIKYIFVPAQAFIILFDYLIESVGENIQKPTFEVVSLIGIVTFAIMCFSLSTTMDASVKLGNTDKGSLSDWEKMRADLDKMNGSKEKAVSIFKSSYNWLPLSYFITVGIVIILLFSIDGANGMRTNIAGFGLVGLIVYALFNILMLSMSIVLSGFSAVPIILYAMYRLMKPPEMGYRSIYIGLLIVSIIALTIGSFFDHTTILGWVAVSTIVLMSTFHVVFLEGDTYKKILTSHYRLPEIDSCDNSYLKKIKLIIKRFWNNKFLFGFMMIFLYISIDMSKSMDTDTHQWWLSCPILIGGFITFLWLIFMFLGIPIKETTVFKYLLTVPEMINSKLGKNTHDTSHDVVFSATESNYASDRSTEGFSNAVNIA